MTPGDIQIKRVQTSSQLKAFIDLPYSLYREDPNWRPPLRFERRAYMDPQKNPALTHIDFQLFLAERGGEYVGRIAAFINHEHQRVHSDNAGHFGFFDCIQAPEVGAALLQAAEDHVRQLGAKKLIGPSSWGVNDECGLMIDGFDTPNVVMMPHGRPDYAEMMAAAGLTKAVDLLAFQNALHEGFPRPKLAQAMYNFGRDHPAISSRTLRKHKIRADIELAMNIFNDAWSENWGFLPFSEAQVSHMVAEMKPILIPDGFVIGFVDGEPAAFVCIIPDVNEAARDMDGRLFPFGWARLLWRIKTKRVKQSRLPLMGLRKKYHNTRIGLGLVTYICEQAMQNVRDRHGITHCEFSWILEDNRPMIRICEHASAVNYKTLRMYEKNL